MKEKKITKLTKREKFLLKCFPDIVFGRKLLISIKTLKLWTVWGMPHHIIEGYIYYNHDEVNAWLDTPATDGKGSNLDMLWEQTPERLLPRKAMKIGNDRYDLVLDKK